MKFSVQVKTNHHIENIGVFANFKDALTCASDYVYRVKNSSEAQLAQEALTMRGYYCIGYSEKEVTIDAVED